MQDTTSKTQAYTLITIVAVIALLLLYSTVLAPKPRWEYRILSFMPDQLSRTGLEAAKPAAITPEAKQLNDLGANGWEVVGNYLEIETAYPNFGHDEYVTGLRENIRPQRLVLLLKRKIR